MFIKDKFKKVGQYVVFLLVFLFGIFVGGSYMFLWMELQNRIQTITERENKITELEKLFNKTYAGLINTNDFVKDYIKVGGIDNVSEQIFQLEIKDE